MSIWNLLNPLAAAAEVAVPIIERFTTTPGESADAKVKLRRVGIEEMREADRPLADQRAINLVEAQHRSIFVAGWRPGVAWICMVGLGVMIVIWPAGTLLAAAFEFEMPPYPMDPVLVLSILGALLGVGKIGRTLEKAKGVASSNLTRP